MAYREGDPTTVPAIVACVPPAAWPLGTYHHCFSSALNQSQILISSSPPAAPPFFFFLKVSKQWQDFIGVRKLIHPQGHRRQAGASRFPLIFALSV